MHARGNSKPNSGVESTESRSSPAFSPCFAVDGWGVLCSSPVLRSASLSVLSFELSVASVVVSSVLGGALDLFRVVGVVDVLGLAGDFLGILDLQVVEEFSCGCLGVFG